MVRSIPACAGERDDPQRRRSGRGSIPACAGETVRFGSRTCARKVNPRLCGGNLFGYEITQPRLGLSPPVRGELAEEFLRHGEQRSIYPRLCGGNVVRAGLRGWPDGPSPPVREKPVSHACRYASARSIPACAGETASSRTLPTTARVYPRLCDGKL